MNLKPFIYSGRKDDLRRVDEEILVDFSDGVDAKYLEDTCCGIAVQDWTRLGDTSYLLKVRPDMRGMLTSQLEDKCTVLRVYRMGDGSGGRSLFTGQMCLHFTEWSSQEDRRSFLERYFPKEGYRPEVEDGMYQLSEMLMEDLGKTWQSLSLEEVILRATPVLAGVPTLGDETNQEDFLTALAQLA
jgi:hypothetical protein